VASAPSRPRCESCKFRRGADFSKLRGIRSATTVARLSARCSQKLTHCTQHHRTLCRLQGHTPCREARLRCAGTARQTRMTETSAAISPACESICFCGRSLSTLDIVRLPVAVVSRRAGVPGVFMSKSYTFDSLLKIFFFSPEKWKMEVLKCMAYKLTLTLQTRKLLLC
jgi:hypothetical protein